MIRYKILTKFIAMQHFKGVSSDPSTQKLSKLWVQILALPKPITLSGDHGVEVIVSDDVTGQTRLHILEQAEAILEKRSSLQN
jgi:hypothetical protein